MNNKDLAEEYLDKGDAWAQKQSAALMLEESKTAVLSQMKKKTGFEADNKAEREVKASEEWSAYIHKMVGARTEANKAKVQMEYARMKWMEQQSFEATERKML